MKLSAESWPIAFLAGAAGLVFWLWSRERAPRTDPQELPQDTTEPINITGPSFVDDNPADEILETLLTADIARRPYSLSYQDGATTIYTRFVDDLSNVNELQNSAEVIHWLNNNRKVQIQ